MNVSRSVATDPDARAARRPQLLLLVYGFFLVLVGITASALVLITTGHVRSTSLDAVVNRDRALVALFVRDHVDQSDFGTGEIDPERSLALSVQLASLVDSDAVMRIAVLDMNGRIVAADRPELAGTAAPSAETLTAALEGTSKLSVLEGDVAHLAGQPTSSPVIEEYLPVKVGGVQIGVIALWRNATDVLAGIDGAGRDVLVVTLGAAAVLALTLFFLFRAAQIRLRRQQEELVDATRQDALTGLLNHGAAVAMLTSSVERLARETDRIGVALIDVDNFRLLNDTHSHDAGDEVLIKVADLLPVGHRERDCVARYGPDEFLVVREGATVADLERLVAHLQQQLGSLSVQFGDSEPLPVTVSVGIATLPDHADGVTELLAAAAAAVAEARGGGGNTVRVAQRADPNAPSAPFNVLQGLVIAVDRKDRYTRRHSEDVSRYAVFIGRRLGLDDEALRSLHIAGLLHDVGKIAIPDTVLRKPGRLTAEEYDIFKQHVALGDSIVRDVPNLEAVRSGIRTHHERWDGGGYLGGLEGEEIPLIGRILAVADAFSAMTTSRPYRKALTVEEALKRLGDAAGTQLEESLVEAFIDGMETAEDAPLPGDEAAIVWLPDLRVA